MIRPHIFPLANKNKTTLVCIRLSMSKFQDSERHSRPSCEINLREAIEKTVIDTGYAHVRQ